MLSPEQLTQVECFVEFLAATARKKAALDRLLAIAPALEAAGVMATSEEEIATFVDTARTSKRLALIGRTVSEVPVDYVEAIRLVEPAVAPRVVAGDVDDDQVIAAAVAARADLIVSGDRRHLLPLGSYRASPSPTQHKLSIGLTS